MMTLAWPRLNFQGYRSCRSVTVTITTKCLCSYVCAHVIIFLFDAHYRHVYKTLMNQYYIIDVQNCLFEKFPSHIKLVGMYATFSHEIINSEIS